MVVFMIGAVVSAIEPEKPSRHQQSQILYELEINQYFKKLDRYRKYGFLMMLGPILLLVLLGFLAA